MSTTNRRRARRRVGRAAKRGQAPGVAVYTGEIHDEPVAVRVMDFDSDGVRSYEQLTDEVRQLADTEGTVTWVDLVGLSDVERVKTLSKVFDIHPLWIEDVLNTSSRPKSEVLDDKLLVIVKMARVVPDGRVDLPEIDTEHVAIIGGPGYLLTFQERPGDVWEPVRARIETGSRIRRMGPAYLLHALLDAVVDEYFVVLEHLEHGVDRVEELTLTTGLRDLPPALYSLRGELSAYRSIVWPVREAVANLVRGEWEHTPPEVIPFFRDLYDHLVQTMDIADSTRERLVGAVDLHLAITSHQLNVVMRVLTVMSTIFIPLTFIVGVYGMNFKYMPELEVSWAYPAVWAVMLAIGLGLVVGFRRRGWF